MKTYIRLISVLLVAAAGLFAKPVLADAIVNTVTQPAWSIGSFVLKQPNLQLGATKAYRTWFENGAWQGDVVEYDVDAAGTRSTDITVGKNPVSDGSSNWSARFEFQDKEDNVTDYWKSTSGRKIITYNADTSAQVAFRWDTISSSQQILLDPDTVTAGTTGSFVSPILNFVRGDRSQEIPNGILRTRHSLLGDTGKVTPLYVGAPTQSLSIAGHSQYTADNAGRAGRVIAAANDGMIHVFDAATGIEIYAYVPSTLFRSLNQLTAQPYVHTWFADGQLASGDAKIGSNWKTLVAGGLGAGGKGLFALDVTTPTLSSETSTADADTKVLWEETGNALGYIHGKPTIAPLDVTASSTGTWYVFSGNGYDSTNDTAVLYMKPVGGGTAITIATDLTPGNGLSAPALVDTDGDADVDVAFAGDLLGRLWKFDLNSPTTAAELLFDAGRSKPITTAPDVAIHPNGGYLVYIGTGSLLSGTNGDADDTSVQTVYAIWDYPNRSTTITDSAVIYTPPGGTSTTVNVLLEQTLTVDEYVDPDDSNNTLFTRLATGNTPNWAYNHGWKVDLPVSGERVIGDIQLRGNRLQFVTDTPTTDTDNPVGESWLLELDWLSGGDINSVFFDLNADGALNDSDKVQPAVVNNPLIVPVGISLGIGNRSQPSFARVANGADTIFINGVNLQIFTCTGICTGGIEGGHIDVDTDSPPSGDGLGGKTDGHVHEYDDKYNITTIDYLNLEDRKLGSVDDTGGNDKDPNIDVNEQFVAILANADFSSGGELFIKNKSWPVKDYQEMIQLLLTNYDGTNTSTLVDADGDSLVFTLQDIIDAVGKLEISFPNTAILEGGLHPTNTGCVNKNASITNDRWRNGALTLHLIKLSTILSGASTGNSWIAQNPTDLSVGMVGGGLHANLANDAGFMYESTLFWHWDGTLAKVKLGFGGMCYGEANWAAARAAEISGLTLTEFFALFPNYALQQDYIDSLVDQLSNFTCKKGTGRKCKKEKDYKALEKLLKGLVGDVKAFLKLRPYLGGGDGSGGVGESSNGEVAPNVDGSGDSDQDVSYSATPIDRISWIDLRD